MKTLIFLLIVLCISTLGIAFAEEPNQISFAEGETKIITLSQNNINHLTVQGDLITHVNCPQGACTVNQYPDDATGSIYLVVNPGKTFTLYLATNSNRHFALQITPHMMAGQTILLVPTDGASQPAKAWETSGAYVQALTRLMKAMMSGDVPEGYGINEKPQEKGDADITTLDKKLSMKLVSQYVGDQLRGEHYLVKNISKDPLTLSPSHFYHPGIRAVALTQQTLKPSETSDLYLIQSSRDRS